jgi:hypothetical protein
VRINKDGRDIEMYEDGRKERGERNTLVLFRGHVD